MHPLSPGHLFRRDMEGREGGMETRAPEWAQLRLFQQHQKESLSPPLTAPAIQLHILELKNHPFPPKGSIMPWVKKVVKWLGMIQF